MIVMVVVLLLFFFNAWQSSIYKGESLNSQYRWKPESPSLLNLAYWKKSVSSSTRFRDNPTLFSGGRVVDGDKRFGSGLVSEPHLNPYWIVDLYDQHRIGDIKIYEGSHIIGSFPVNSRPLMIKGSNDCKNWVNISVILDRHENPILVNFFQEPLTFRFIGVFVSGNCILALDEVEIFPPLK
jgi:hypothetical protein